MCEPPNCSPGTCVLEQTPDEWLLEHFEQNYRLAGGEVGVGVGCARLMIQLIDDDDENQMRSAAASWPDPFLSHDLYFESNLVH